jgi:four helix bundle protein
MKKNTTMSYSNIVQEKAFQFSLHLIPICIRLSNEKREFVLSKQLLKSSTSIGANLEEAIGGFSKKDFHYKISISYKEARETRYWLKLLVASDLINMEDGNLLLDELDEILKILGRTIITLNQKNSA